MCEIGFGGGVSTLHLEDIFPVPCEEAPMRAKRWVERFDRFAVGPEESVEAFRIVDVARDEDR